MKKDKCVRYRISDNDFDFLKKLTFERDITQRKYLENLIVGYFVVNQDISGIKEDIVEFSRSITIDCELHFQARLEAFRLHKKLESFISRLILADLYREKKLEEQRRGKAAQCSGFLEKGL